MTTTLLPLPPEVSGSLTELAVPFIHAKALIDPQPTGAEYGLDGALLAVVSAENVLNTVNAARSRKPVTALLAGGLATISANAALTHANKVLDGTPVCHKCEPQEQRNKERVATVIFTAAQVFVNRSLGK